jgi:hypothetical protein
MYTITVIITLLGKPIETKTPVDSLAICQTQAREITGSKAKGGFVFSDKKGHITAICKPIDANTLSKSGVKL